MNAQYLIESVRLTSSASAITFSNIPIQFSHLSLVSSSRSDRSLEIDEGIQEWNGYSGNYYKYSAIRSYGTTLDAVNTQSKTGNWGLGANGANNPANTFGLSTSTIIAQNDMYMSPFITRTASTNNAIPQGNFIIVGSQYSLGRISSITIRTVAGTVWVAGSVISLYGSRQDNKLG